jgi:hypothetical protein
MICCCVVMQSTKDPSTCGTECGTLVNCTASLPQNVDTATCPAGACEVGSCLSSFADCNTNFTDGSETVSVAQWVQLAAFPDSSHVTAQQTK